MELSIEASKLLAWLNRYKITAAAYSNSLIIKPSKFTTFSSALTELIAAETVIANPVIVEPVIVEPVVKEPVVVEPVVKEEEEEN